MQLLIIKKKGLIITKNLSTKKDVFIFNFYKKNKEINVLFHFFLIFHDNIFGFGYHNTTHLLYGR